MRERKSLTTNWLLFLIGLGAYPSIKVVGYITIAEFMLLLIGPFVLMQNVHLLRRSSVMPFLWLAVAWMMSAILSDFYRRTAYTEYFRGWGRVFMLGWSLLILYLLLRPNPRAFVYFALGMVPSSVIILFWGRTGLGDYEQMSGVAWQNSWETTYVYIAFNLGVLVSSYFCLKRPRLTAWFLCLVGALCVVNGSRALGAVLIISALTAAFFRFNTSMRTILNQHMTWKGFLLFAGFAGLLAYAIFEVYVTLASLGYLGERSLDKYDIQSSGRYGIILSGRSNVVGAALALADSPLIGYGSWAEDRNGYFYQAMEILGFDPRGLTTEEVLFGSRIPTHSYVLEAWVEHGFVASWFWFYTLWFIVKLTRRAAALDPALVALLCVQTWLFVWNIFFSPLGGRVVIGAGLAIMICAYERAGEPTVRPNGPLPFPRRSPALPSRGVANSQA